MGLERAPGAGLQRVVVKEDIVHFLQSLEPYAHATDPWTHLTYGKMMHRAGRWLARLELAGAEETELALVRPVREMVVQNYAGITGLIEAFLEQGEDDRLPMVQQLLEKAESMIGEADSSKERIGRFHYLKGYLAYKHGNMEEAIEHFEYSYEQHPHKENPSKDAIKTLGKG